MKKIIFALALFASTVTFAQNNYAGLSSGINNITGVLGPFLELSVVEHLTIKTGVGVGAWGTKFGIGGKYYPSFPNSFSYGLGYSFASGGTNAEIEIETVDRQKVDAVYNLTPAHMLDITFGKSWGEKFRFNIEFGYSIRLSGGEYDLQDKSVTPTPQFKSALDLMSPGGLIFGIGGAYGF